MNEKFVRFRINQTARGSDYVECISVVVVVSSVVIEKLFHRSYVKHFLIVYVTVCFWFYFTIIVFYTVLF